MKCDFCGEEDLTKPCDCIGALTGEPQPGNHGEKLMKQLEDAKRRMQDDR